MLRSRLIDELSWWAAWGEHGFPRPDISAIAEWLGLSRSPGTLRELLLAARSSRRATALEQRGWNWGGGGVSLHLPSEAWAQQRKQLRGARWPAGGEAIFAERAGGRDGNYNEWVLDGEPDAADGTLLDLQLWDETDPGAARRLLDPRPLFGLLMAAESDGLLAGDLEPGWPYPIIKLRHLQRCLAWLPVDPRRWGR